MRFKFLLVGGDVLDAPKAMDFPLGIVLLMRFEFLPVGVDVLGDPKAKEFPLRIGVLPRLNILPVGTGVLDGPESNKFCFLNGYWYVATRKANAFSSRTVERLSPPVPTRFDGNRIKERSRIIPKFIYR